MGGTSTRLPTQQVVKAVYMGSLGDDSGGDNTLSQPTITDRTFQWQANVLAQLQAGVTAMKHAELQKWLQIAATLSIPLAAAIWRAVFRRGSSIGDPTV
jgi:hypothetical protein